MSGVSEVLKKRPIWQSLIFIYKLLMKRLLLRSKILLAGFIILPGIVSVSYAQSIRLFAVSDLVRVFEDGYKLPALKDTITMFGIRGEVISGQFVINPSVDISSVTVEISSVSNQAASYTLPQSALEWNFVGSIPLSKNTPNQPAAVLTRQAPASFPDYLKGERYVSISGSTYRSVWLTLKIPGSAEAGSYSGTGTVKSTQGNQSLPLRITIYPFSLPSERHLKVTEWYSTSKFSTLHGIPPVTYSAEWLNMLKIYAENMAAHRQNVFRISMGTISIIRNSEGKLLFDFFRFDQLAQIFWDTGNMDYLETGFLARFKDGGWSSTEIVLNDFTVKDQVTGQNITLPGEEVIPYLLPAFENHLREKDWLNKTYFHIQDEPSPHNSLSWCSISQYMHQFAPELVRMDAIESTFVLNDIEVAVPKLDHFGDWYESFREARQRGVEIWFYTVGIYQASMYPNKTIDMPLIDSRLMHWLNYKYDATGYLHWGWNSWTDDPFTDASQHIGDGWHVYPALGNVLNSLRWEQMRNGIQDYEYFWMLENRISKLKDSLGLAFSWIDPQQRSKDILRNVVTDFTQRSYDPVVLYKAKLEIIRELQQFDISPRLYVQTNPGANSTIEKGSTVAVAGWTESGTTVTVNGVNVPVNEQGIFMEELGLSSTYNTIRVKATGSKGTNEITRTFKVKSYATGLGKKAEVNDDLLMVYPNPVKQHLSVEVPHTGFDVQIIDLTGRCLYQKKNNFNRTEMNCTMIPVGIYFIIVNDGNRIFSRKIIKQD